MKSIIYIVSTFLTMTFSPVMAETDSAPETSINAQLSPVVPKEATFEETFTIPSDRISILTPTVPLEADFNDSI